MFYGSIRGLPAGLALAARTRDLLIRAGAGAFFVLVAGCTAPPTLQHRSHGAGAAGMVGFSSSGGAATGGRGGAQAAGGALENDVGDGGDGPQRGRGASGEGSGGTQPAASRDGNGSGGVARCGPCEGGYVCSRGSCKTSCTTDSDCLSDHFCSGNACRVDAIQVSISSTHACMVLADGTARCWGQNDSGQLGNTSSSN